MQVAAVTEPAATQRRDHLSRRLAVPAVAAASCVLAVVLFGVGARDDPYITYWVAEQLAKTGRLVNINGVHVEQSSSFAHVLMLAALYFITRLPLPVLGYLLGLVGLFATVLLSAHLASLLRVGTRLATAIVVAIGFPFVYWATGGLETDLAAASMLWFLVSLHALLTQAPRSRAVVASFVASTIVIVTIRPDTMIVAALVVLAVLAVACLQTASSGRFASLGPAIDLRAAVIAVGTVLATIGGLTALRLLVFGSILPQPELVKVGGLSWFLRGFSYVFTSFPWWMWVTFVVLYVLGAAWSARQGSLAGCLAAATVLAGVVLLCFSRGDWMGGARLLVPYLAPAFVVMVAGAWTLQANVRRAAIGVVIAVELITLVLFANGTPWLSSQFTAQIPSAAASSAADFGSFLGGSWSSTPATHPPLPWYEAWDFIGTRDAAFLSTATPVLRRLLEHVPPGRSITIASPQAGMVMYTWANDFPGRIRFIDMDGIATTYFSTCNNATPSFAGDHMTIATWAIDSGRCAPSLPDLYFDLNRPADQPMLAKYYNVISSISIRYVRHGATGSAPPLYGTEYLAQRRGWTP